MTINVPYIAARWKGGTQNEIRRIVIHATVSPCVPGGARAVANFFARGTSRASAHYVRDPRETIQCVFDHTVAWHDGTNVNSIGYELCDPMSGPASRWFDSNHSQMLAGAAADIRAMCAAWGIPVRRLSPAQIRQGQKGICGHADMRDAFPGSTTHYDPGVEFPWSHFLELINNGRPGIPAPTRPSRKGMIKVIDRELVPGPNYHRIICPTGAASTIVGRAWVSISASGGVKGRVAFQASADTDNAAPGTRPLWDLDADNAERLWQEIPSGTEYLEMWLECENPGAVLVEFEPK